MTKNIVVGIVGHQQLRGKHDDVIKWKLSRVPSHLCGEFIGHRWIPRTKASDTELWYYLWSAPE